MLHFLLMKFNTEVFNLTVHAPRTLKGVFPDLRLSYKPTNVNRSIFATLNQKTSLQDMYGVVYQIPYFGDGFESCDISQTGLKVGTRGQQYLDDIEQFDHDKVLEDATALVHHFNDLGYVPVLESLHILSNHHENQFLVSAFF